MKILIVEDHADTLDLMREVLSEEGHEVTTATDGVEAQNILKKDSSYDLLITDAIMPNLDGRELIKWAKTSAALKHLKIILVTGLAKLKFDLADEILEKPYTLGQLLSLVENMKSRRKYASNPDELHESKLARANEKILEIAGKKKNLSSALADEILVAYYQAMGYRPDHRSKGWLSPDEKTKIVFSSRNVQSFSGGRGNWQKRKSISKKDAAETLLAKAREDSGISVGGKSALQDLRARREVKVEKKKVRVKKSELESLAKLASMIHVSQELQPVEKLSLLAGYEEAALERRMDALAKDYLDALPPETSSIEDLKNQIQAECSTFNPPVPLAEDGYSSVAWEEEGVPISLRRVSPGIDIQIGSSIHPIDPFGMRVSFNFMPKMEEGSGYIAGAIHTRKKTPIPALFMIISHEKQKGAGTKLLRLFCQLMKGFGFKKIVVQGVGEEGQMFLRSLHRKGLIDIITEGRDWIIQSSDILDDPSQMKLFPSY